MASKMKLDMSHGFIQSIIKNQVSRDNYDKEVKSREKPKPIVNNNQPRQKKPERQTYVPPPKGNRQVTYPTSEDTSDLPSSKVIHSNGLPPSPKESDITVECFTEQSPYRYDRSQPVPMFLLRYEDEHGNFHEAIVHRSDDPFVLARRFGNEQGLAPPMIKALSKCLREEMRRRTRQPDPEQ